MLIKCAKLALAGRVSHFFIPKAWLILMRQNSLTSKTFFFMSDVNQTLNMPSDIKPPVPSGINVLTILTFIGCGLVFCALIWNLLGGAKKSLDKMEEMVNSSKFDEMPSLVKKMYSPENIELARKGYENRVPISLVGLLGVALCVVGAIQMRKLKQQGYYVYLIGELMPVLASLVFIGVASLANFNGIITIVFTLLFILLYSAQRKHLVNK